MNNTTITINKGNCQFNSKDCANFRKVMAKYHNAKFKISDIRLECSTIINNNIKNIEVDESRLERLNNGEKMIGKVTKESLEKSIADYKQKVADERENMRVLIEKSRKDCDNAYALIGGTKSNGSDCPLYMAYKNDDGYAQGLANLLSNNGVVPCEETINALITCNGKRANSARAMYKSQKHNGKITFKAWRDILLGELCDLMGDNLPIYKYSFKPIERKKKSEN